MNVSIHANADAANTAAADTLAQFLLDPKTRNVMVAAGNTPIDLYKRIAQKGLNLSHLNIFVLDEYVGVPADEPRNCASLLRETVRDGWGIPSAQFHSVSPMKSDALESVLRHEERIASLGGLDVSILGLGQNGHLGFNEPGSAEDSTGRILDLEIISVEANRKWFGGDYAPDQGVTVGLRTILATRSVILLAYGLHKVNAVHGMVSGPRDSRNPASFLQTHLDTHIFIDRDAASGLESIP